MNNSIKFTVPASLEKSKEGDWKVKGLASTQNLDRQGEVIVQKGIDLTPIDQKRGVLNWDHKPGIENMVGVLDGYSKDDKGLYVEGRLFKNHDKARAIYGVMSSLSDSDKGRIGLSVEGKILERDKANPKIIKKCKINAVAITMNPVNSDTYADLVKSMNVEDDNLVKSLTKSELEFDATENQSSEIKETSIEETTFTTTQVLAILEKAMAITQDRGNTPPNKLSGGSAMETSNMGKDKKKKKEDKKVEVEPEDKSELKPMTKSLYKAVMNDILDHLQLLYPENEREEIWECLKERLTTRYPKIDI